MNGRRFVSITALGAVTIAGFGAWYYSFGVLLDPIIADTNWSEAALTSGFGVGLAVGGILAVPAGRLLDALGSRPVFLTAAVVSTAALWTASMAESLLTFLVLAGLGGATHAALGFYHITQTTAVRVAPDEPARAIALLTMYGALASAIFLPLAAALVGGHGWRPTVRTLAVITGIVFLVAAFIVKEEERPERRHDRMGLRGALADPVVTRFAAAVAAIGITAGILLVYQVPVMTAAGLPLATASWFAGARGVAQLTGRIPISIIVRRLGPRRSLIVAYGAIVTGVGLLSLSGNVVVAGMFALVAGFGIGAMSPLQGIFADTVFDRSELGEMMGYIALLFGLTGALGPAIAGVLAETTGSRLWGLVIAGASGMAAVAFIRSSRSGVAASA